MKKMFTSPKMVFLFIITQSILLFLVMTIAIFGTGGNYEFSIGIIIMFIAYSLYVFHKDRNAFVRFWVDDDGIHNKYHSVKWENIDKYDLGEVVVQLVRKNISTRKYCPSVIYFGNYCPNKAFRQQDLTECVCISIIPAHLALLEKYGKRKSKVIDEVLQRYYFETIGG